MKRFRTWLADKLWSLSYRLEDKAKSLRDLERRIRPKLRYADMDRFQRSAHDEVQRITPTIVQMMTRKSPFQQAIEDGVPIIRGNPTECP